MNALKMMSFKSRNRVDWKQTQANIRDFVNSKAPDALPSEKALWSADIELGLRRWVKEFTVPLCFDTVQTFTVKGKPK